MFLAISKSNPLDVMTEVDNLPRLLRRISNHGDELNAYTVIRVDGVELKKGFLKSCAHFLTHEELRDIGKQYGVDVHEFKPRVRRIQRSKSKSGTYTVGSGEVAGFSGEGWAVQTLSSETVPVSDGIHHTERINKLRGKQGRRARHS